MDMGYISTVMEVYTKENGKMDKGMERGNL